MGILTINDVDYYYQDGDSKRYILQDVNYIFERGKFYAILGESGSGKTTLISLLSALDKPHSGNVLFENQDIQNIGLSSYRRNKASIIFQAYNLIPYMTALENVKMAMSITDNELPKDESIPVNLLDYIGLDKSKINRTVNKLSGGEQQRVAIARALSTNVDIILADEPTGNLNEELETEIIHIFRNLAHQHQKCVIVVTHSSQIARQADEILQLKKGKLNSYEPVPESIQ